VHHEFLLVFNKVSSARGQDYAHPQLGERSLTVLSAKCRFTVRFTSARSPTDSRIYNQCMQRTIASRSMYNSDRSPVNDQRVPQNSGCATAQRPPNRCSFNLVLNKSVLQQCCLVAPDTKPAYCEQTKCAVQHTRISIPETGSWRYIRAVP
jgi:hypothetical protein